MSLEREIREALMKHAEDVRPDAEAFDGIEKKVTRAHRLQLTATVAFGLAVLAAAAIAIPRLGGEPDAGFAGQPTDEPTNTVATADSQPLRVYRTERDSFQTWYPKDWRVGGFEGSVEFTPPGLMGLTVGEDTFSVEFQHRIGERYDDRSEVKDTSFWRWDVRIAGRDTASAEIVNPDGTHQMIYRVDWTGAGCAKGALCDAEIATLRILIHGSTEDLWDDHFDDGHQIVMSLKTTQDADWPSDMRVTTARGAVAAAVEWDERTQTLVRWLDARAEGAEAEGLMTDEAKAQYRARDGEFGLYGYGDPPEAWITYTVTDRLDADANSSEFIVRLETRKPGGAEVSVTERIGVGAGGGGYEIRFATVEGFEE